LEDAVVVVAVATLEIVVLDVDVAVPDEALAHEHVVRLVARVGLRDVPPDGEKRCEKRHDRYADEQPPRSPHEGSSFQAWASWRCSSPAATSRTAPTSPSVPPGSRRRTTSSASPCRSASCLRGQSTASSPYRTRSPTRPASPCSSSHAPAV